MKSHSPIQAPSGGKTKIFFSDTEKGRSNVGVIKGEDGDLFVAYEGGIPVRLRELLDAFYKHSNRMREIKKVSYLLHKADQKFIEEHRNWFRDLEYDPSLDTHKDL